MYESSHKLVLPILKQKPLDAINAVKRLSIEQLAGRIDRHALNLRSPVSNGIKVLKGDAPRINFRVA